VYIFGIGGNKAEVSNSFSGYVHSFLNVFIRNLKLCWFLTSISIYYCQIKMQYNLVKYINKAMNVIKTIIDLPN